MILAARSMVVRVELGIQQSRHSTLNSYLEKLLYLLTGNFGRRGTNGIHTWLQPLFRDSQGERSTVTGPGDHRRPAADQPLRRRGADRRPAPRPRRLGRLEQPRQHRRRHRALRGGVSRARALGRGRRRLHRDGGARGLRAAGRRRSTRSGRGRSSRSSGRGTSSTCDRRCSRRFAGTLPEPEIYTRLLRAMGDLPERRRARRAARARRRAPRQDDEARLPDVRRESEARADRGRRCSMRRSGRRCRTARPPPRRSMPPAIAPRWSTRSRSSAPSRRPSTRPCSASCSSRSCSRAARASSSPRTSTTRSSSS